MNGSIQIIPIWKASGADRYGNCAVCSVLSNESKIYRFCFMTHGTNQGTSICLCSDCIKLLKDKIDTALEESE